MDLADIVVQLAWMKGKQVRFTLESSETGRIEGVEVEDCSRMPDQLSCRIADGSILIFDVKGAEFEASGSGQDPFLVIKRPDGRSLTLYPPAPMKRTASG